MLHCAHSNAEREMDPKKELHNETTKAVWEAPTIEEIDYAQTEAQYGVPGSAEFGLYTN
jgi:hypothetical protein